MTDPGPLPDPATYARMYRILSIAMMSAIVLIAVLATFILPGSDAMPEQPLLLLAPVAVAVALHLLAENVGYKGAALDPAAAPADLMRETQIGWQSLAILRLALTESLGIMGLAAAFVVTDGGLAIVWLSAVLSLALMIFHGHAWSRPVLMVTVMQERGGATSPLPEIFGVTRPDGVIRRM